MSLRYAPLVLRLSGKPSACAGESSPLRVATGHNANWNSESVQMLFYFSVKLLDHLPEIVFAHIYNTHLALGILLRVARVSGIYHHGLAELAPNRTRWGC